MVSILTGCLIHLTTFMLTKFKLVQGDIRGSFSKDRTPYPGNSI